jgi:hypothetical protein
VPTDTDIANSALVQLRGNPIASLEADRDDARAVKATFVIERDALLRELDWGFASERPGPLAEASPAPTWGFAHAYTLPARCLVVREVEGEPHVTWRQEGGQLLTDEAAPLRVRWTQRIEAAERFSASFTAALVARLRWKLAFFVTGSRTVEQDELKAYRLELEQAKIVESQEGVAPSRGDADELVRVR